MIIVDNEINNLFIRTTANLSYSYFVFVFVGYIKLVIVDGYLKLCWFKLFELLLPFLLDVPVILKDTPAFVIDVVGVM